MPDLVPKPLKPVVKTPALRPSVAGTATQAQVLRQNVGAAQFAPPATKEGTAMPTDFSPAFLDGFADKCAAAGCDPDLVAAFAERIEQEQKQAQFAIPAGMATSAVPTAGSMVPQGGQNLVQSAVAKLKALYAQAEPHLPAAAAGGALGAAAGAGLAAAASKKKDQKPQNTGTTPPAAAEQPEKSAAATAIAEFRARIARK